MHVGQKIKQLRKAHKLTQEELAKILDVKPTAVSAWELGRNKPLMDKLDMMAHYSGEVSTKAEQSIDYTTT